MALATFSLDNLSWVQDVCRRLPIFLDRIERDLIKDQDVAGAQRRYHKAMEAMQGVSTALHNAKIGREWTEDGSYPPDHTPIPDEVRKATSLLASVVFMP